MSKADRIKEEIGWLKVGFGLPVVTDVSLMAWLAQNYRTGERIVLTTGLMAVAVAVVTIATIWVNRLAVKRFKELERE